MIAQAHKIELNAEPRVIMGRKVRSLRQAKRRISRHSGQKVGGGTLIFS